MRTLRPPLTVHDSTPAPPRRPGLIWSVRNRLSPQHRSRVRRVTDGVLAPVGSIAGVVTTDRVFGLTFDDGPDPDSTPGVLDALAGHGVLATFFLLVERARCAPGLVRRMVDEGHEVALHGGVHERLTDRPYRVVKQSLAAAAEELAGLSGRPLAYFRPPLGAQGLRSYFAARSVGLEVVVWTSDVEDWVDATPDAIADRAVAGLAPGGILLLHDALVPEPPTAPQPTLDRPAMVQAVCARTLSEGWRPAPVTDLLASGSVHRTAWFRP